MTWHLPSLVRTVVSVFDARNDQIRDALMSLYGLVAAVVRDDREGIDLLLNDLRESFDNPHELLTAIAFVTLDRLDATIDDCGRLDEHDGRNLASDLLTLARHYDLAGPGAVEAAAWRLDAVRRRNHSQMVAEIDDARALATDDDLLAGAIALLTATVSLWARRTGQSPRRAAADLCLLASLESVS
jgi:hypothetical protein